MSEKPVKQGRRQWQRCKWTMDKNFRSLRGFKILVHFFAVLTGALLLGSAIYIYYIIFIDLQFSVIIT